MMRDAQNWLEKNDGLVKRAIQLGNEASREAKEKFPGESLHNGIGDASRHALWNEKLTREFGAPVASVITTLYETKNFIEALDYTDGRGPRLDETAMDMANNWIGRQRIDVDWLSRNGLLVTLKNDPKPEEDSRPEAEPKPEAELKSEPEGQGEAYE